MSEELDTPLEYENGTLLFRKQAVLYSYKEDNKIYGTYFEGRDLTKKIN